MSDVEFENVDETELPGDNIPDDGGLSETSSKPPKTPKQPKAPRTKGTVTVVSLDHSSILGGKEEGIGLGLKSVAGKDYNFTDQSQALKWLTRRDYNGEKLAVETAAVHESLAFVRTALTLNKIVARTGEWLSAINKDTPSPFARASVQSKRIDAALNEIPSHPASFDAYFRQVTELQSYLGMVETATDIKPEDVESYVERGNNLVQSIVNMPIYLDEITAVSPAPVPVAVVPSEE